jgi:DNA-binding response OmpR family regulator
MEITTLLIDDELTNLRLLIEFLKHKDFRIIVAQNGNEGLHLANCTQPELILLDVRMPDIDGFTVYKRLLENPKTANSLVIFLSAIDDIEYKEYALNLGGADYITKPIDARELIARIHAHLSRQRQYQTALARLADYECHIRANKFASNKIDNGDINANKTQIISEYLLNNLQRTPTLNELAQIANTNRTSVNVHFRNLFGMSIFEWLTEQRLLRAAILLRTSSIPIQNIAENVGYANTSALTHAFKRRFECTPGEYRLLDAKQVNSKLNVATIST